MRYDAVNEIIPLKEDKVFLNNRIEVDHKVNT